MRALEIIEKKRDGKILSSEEIDYFVQNYNNGTIPDYQMAAFAMAVFFQSMNAEETAALTGALVRSGETLDFSGLGRPVADKHSTGGVGDKTTLVLLPLVAANGVTVAKLSGRGLGHTGGTIDKLSCIPGFRSDLSRDEFSAQVKREGLAIMGQSPQMTPADGKLYALRDVTATVDSIPLIASSVMSKKIAAGAQAIVLDVKAGSGAFMQDAARAGELARAMVEIGRALGKNTSALITAMDQPLGLAVGNHLEVAEAIETLHGEGPSDLVELCLELGAEILLACGVAGEREKAREKLSESLRNGEALAAFRRFVSAQGGDAAITENPDLLGEPAYSLAVQAPKEGWITGLDARTVGTASVLLGAGREKKGDPVDLLAGIRLVKKTGDYTTKGELLATVFASDREKLSRAAEKLASAYDFADAAPSPRPLILGRVAHNM
ncbi:MAG: thymidine phosphorylase [Bacillota bacterium]|nr:thymidine phosphorylase [Bacillota bacterium]